MLPSFIVLSDRLVLTDRLHCIVVLCDVVLCGIIILLILLHFE